MKYLRLMALFLSGCVMGFALLLTIWLLMNLPAWAEERQERRQHETQEYIDGVRNHCKYAYPLDLISRYTCMERLI